MDTLSIRERIIYFDQNFCVVTKLPGENSQSDIPRIFQNELENLLVKKIDFIECPHRLDMPVSGVQIISFNKETFDLAKFLVSKGAEIFDIYNYLYETDEVSTIAFVNFDIRLKNSPLIAIL